MKYTSSNTWRPTHSVRARILRPVLLLLAVIITSLSLLGFLFGQRVLEQEALNRTAITASYIEDVLQTQRATSIAELTQASRQRIVDIATTLGGTARLILIDERGIPTIVTGDRLQPILPVQSDNWAVRAQQGEEQTGITIDDRAIKVVAASRSLTTTSIALTLQYDHHVVLAPLRNIAGWLLVLSVLLLAFAALLVVFVADEVVVPIKYLVAKVRRIAPPHWKTGQRMQTDDELEVLDRQVHVMARRLQQLYGHLEDEVAAATAELKKQYAKDRTILESMDHGIIVVNAKGMIESMNPAATELLQSKSDVIGKQVRMVASLEGDAKEHPVQRCLKTKKVVQSAPNAAVSLRRKDDTLPVRYSAIPLLNSRKLEGALFVVEDERMQRTLRSLKSEFITVASHQMRTPLSIIRWQLDILRKGKHFTKEQKDAARDMRTALKRFDSLLNALLKMASFERDGLKPSKQQCAIAHVLDTVMESLASEVKTKSIRIERKEAKSLPRISTDPDLLQIALHNVVMNAIQYSPAGKTVTLATKKYRKGIEITISDKGIGFSMQERKRLFEPLFRGKKARTMATEGNGLGLSMTHTIITALGGKVEVDSAEGKGTTVTIRL